MNKKKTPNELKVKARKYVHTNHVVEKNGRLLEFFDEDAIDIFLAGYEVGRPTELTTQDPYANWIGVNRRVPERLKNVLCAVKGYQIGYYVGFIDEAGAWYIHDSQVEYPAPVTYWMSFPKVPKDE